MTREHEREKLQSCDNCLHEVVSGNETEMHYDEAERTQQNVGARSRKPASNCGRNRSQKMVLTAHEILRLAESCHKNHVIRVRASLGSRSPTESVLAEVNRFTRVSDPTLACVVKKLLHGDTPAHECQLVQEYLADENIKTSPPCPCSADPAPCDVLFFPHHTKCLAGRRFNSRLSPV